MSKCGCECAEKILCVCVGGDGVGGGGSAPCGMPVVSFEKYFTSAGTNGKRNPSPQTPRQEELHADI